MTLIKIEDWEIPYELLEEYIRIVRLTEKISTRYNYDFDLKRDVMKMKDNLEVKYLSGSISESENEIFFTRMTQQQMWEFQDKVLNVFWNKLYSNIDIVGKVEDRILTTWLKYHRIDKENR